ncbi:efflux RND transporter permease subunit [Bremerella alba]|uniref:Cobalt-zinc-cadmium resistance protein CzcA n=1 Tax=Bremerella alba TaxID=980252 RepID=A0A7V9A5J3_9BACT|nr:efflux RND transporter permease subunit [Bremerella alba]MBA2113237.1 Cobalt-zinc-cadmium resistance protein CzcA [Bremerella alba]
MLNNIILFALRNRLVVVMAALAVIVVGSVVTVQLPIDVLPNLTRPRVVIIAESHGLSPEEVEQRITYVLERSLIGASGVQAVRSSSDIGFSVIYVEFDWGTDIYTARQIVQERLALEKDNLPPETDVQMAPMSSLLGQIMMVGMWSDDGTTSPLEIRTMADWTVRQRLLTIPGVAQVITMGGGRKQYQVLVDLHKMHQYDLQLSDIEDALSQSNLNVTGGYVNRSSQELLVRGLGLLKTIDDIKDVPLTTNRQRPVLMRHIAEIKEGAQIKRGDSSINGRDAVVLTIQKQPNVDTRLITQQINAAIADLKLAMPQDVQIETTYQQRDFIDHSVTNVIEALRDGAILVVIILFLFLFNFRTTFITVTAIPLSILVTSLIFYFLGMSINVMTLGGIAVAMGELVDDAIVDVENIFRRLKANAKLENPRPILKVIFEASVEVRNAIIISTVLVIVVFAPLFALSGMEGRLFTPLGVAYIISILASTLVSLTVTPVLSYYLLPSAKATHSGDGAFLRFLKWIAQPVVRASLTPNGISIILSGVLIAVVGSGFLVMRLGTDFLPPFDEGAVQVNLFAPPGTSLETSRKLAKLVDDELAKLTKSEANPTGPLLWYTTKTGRAEQDEHAMGVNVTETVISLNPEVHKGRDEMIAILHEATKDVPGIEIEIEQPIAHLISHMLSGVTAQIAIKIYGDDLTQLRRTANNVKNAISDIEGIAPPVVEQQAMIPQFRVELKRDALAFYGVPASYVNETIETALNGRVVTQMYQGQRTFDVLVRLEDRYRTDLEGLHRFPLELENGQHVPLSVLANVYEAGGPNTIKREDGRRRIVVRVNTLGKDLGTAVAEIDERIRNDVDFPEGYFFTMGGQFEAQQSASTRIFGLSIVALLVTFVVLYSAYPSTSIVLQILFSLPAAFVGGVLALLITGQTLSIAALVGFISLGGIAARNGLLLVSTYLEQYREEGFTQQMIVNGSLERLAPVLMTALTTGIGLVPLVIGGSQPGKEMLFPVATVILGGLVTSTFCEFLVRPGMFWFFGKEAAQRLATEEDSPDSIE